MNSKSFVLFIFILHSLSGFGQEDLREDGAIQLEFRGLITFSDSIQKPAMISLHQAGLTRAEVAIDSSGYYEFETRVCFDSIFQLHYTADNHLEKWVSFDLRSFALSSELPPWGKFVLIHSLDIEMIPKRSIQFDSIEVVRFDWNLENNLVRLDAAFAQKQKKIIEKSLQNDGDEK